MVIVIGRCMKEYLVEQGVPQERLCIITNWANESEIFPVPCHANPLRREFGLEGAFVVLYSGNMGASHDFDAVLEVARRLRIMPNLRFVFIGNGVRRKEIERAKDASGLDNVILLPFQPIERLAYSLSMGDVHFISLRDGFEGLVVPSKAYGSLAAGRPIIYQGSARGDVGVVVASHDPDALETAILRYYESPALVAEQGEKARQLALTRFSRQHALEQYGKLLDMIAR
jgi:glycosyltransferase involved in cell wall biosynthesis